MKFYKRFKVFATRRRPETRASLLNPGFGLPALTRGEVAEMIQQAQIPKDKQACDRHPDCALKGLSEADVPRGYGL